MQAPHSITYNLNMKKVKERNTQCFIGVLRIGYLGDGTNPGKN